MIRGAAAVAVPEEDAASRIEHRTRPVVEHVKELAEALLGLLRRPSDDRGPDRSAAERTGQRRGEITELGKRESGRELCQPRDLSPHARHARRVEQQQFSILPGAHELASDPSDVGPTHSVGMLHDHVRIDAAEPHGRSGGANGCALRPGLGAIGDPDRRPLSPQDGMTHMVTGGREMIWWRTTSTALMSPATPAAALV